MQPFNFPLLLLLPLLLRLLLLLLPTWHIFMGSLKTVAVPWSQLLLIRRLHAPDMMNFVSLCFIRLIKMANRQRVYGPRTHACVCVSVFALFNYFLLQLNGAVWLRSVDAPWVPLLIRRLMCFTTFEVSFISSQQLARLLLMNFGLIEMFQFNFKTDFICR